FDADSAPTAHEDLPTVLGRRPRIFPNAMSFAQAALKWLGTERPSPTASADGGSLEPTAPADLQYLARRLPREAVPENFRFLLTNDKGVIQEDMTRARDDETGTFGKLQYLWGQHPVFEWLMQTVADAFGRHTAPVMRLPS